MMAQKNIDCRIRALIGGGCASVVSQTIVVPFDIISQHLMVLGIIQNKTSKVQVHAHYFHLNSFKL